MDISPLIPSDRKVIDSLADDRFRIGGEIYLGPVLVFPDRVLPWAIAEGAPLGIAGLEPVLEDAGTDILLIGMGARMRPLPPALRQQLRAAGKSADGMDTGAACSTYNVLLSEGRRVAAALLPRIR